MLLGIRHGNRFPADLAVQQALPFVEIGQSEVSYRPPTDRANCPNAHHASPQRILYRC